MKAKTFKNQAAQGDLFIRRIKTLPKNITLVLPKDGQYIVAHSETGHNHVIEATENVTFYKTEDPMVSYLQVIEATEITEALLKHLRSFDTHQTISISPGIYELRRQREYIPQGWRQIMD